MMMFFFSLSDVVGKLTVATRYRSLGRRPGFSCGSPPTARRELGGSDNLPEPNGVGPPTQACRARHRAVEAV